MANSTERVRPSWEKYFIALARTVAIRSPDPYFQVGAVVVRENNTVASIGYNGPPPSVEVDFSDRNRRRSYMIHAEVNALRFTEPDEGSIIAVTHTPCQECLKTIASYNIKSVIYGNREQSLGTEGTIAASVAEEFGIALRYVEMSYVK